MPAELFNNLPKDCKLVLGDCRSDDRFLGSYKVRHLNSIVIRMLKFDVLRTVYDGLFHHNEVKMSRSRQKSSFLVLLFHGIYCQYSAF